MRCQDLRNWCIDMCDKMVAFIGNWNNLDHIKVIICCVLVFIINVECYWQLENSGGYIRISDRNFTIMQPLDESGYSQVEFGDPDLFLHCCIEGKLQNQSCLFIPTSENAERKTGRAVWRIPSGIKSHGGFVSVVTFVSAFISTILIVLTSFFCSDFKTCNKLKCS